jgi:hypothetical protein
MRWDELTGSKDIWIVGIPKSGTHAAEKACKLLGLKTHVDSRHSANYHLAEDRKVLFIYRNPRDLLISTVRYRSEQQRYPFDISQEKLVEVFFDLANASLPAVLTSFERWFETEALSLKLETLVQSPQGINEICDYMGIPHRLDAFYELPGGTATWNDKQSNWKDHWGCEIEKVWKEEGMYDVETKWGYEDNHRSSVLTKLQ